MAIDKLPQDGRQHRFAIFFLNRNIFPICTFFSYLNKIRLIFYKQNLKKLVLMPKKSKTGFLLMTVCGQKLSSAIVSCYGCVGIRKKMLPAR